MLTKTQTFRGGESSTIEILCVHLVFFFHYYKANKDHVFHIYTFRYTVIPVITSVHKDAGTKLLGITTIKGKVIRFTFTSYFCRISRIRNTHVQILERSLLCICENIIRVSAMFYFTLHIFIWKTLRQRKISLHTLVHSLKWPQQPGFVQQKLGDNVILLSLWMTGSQLLELSLLLPRVYNSKKLEWEAEQKIKSNPGILIWYVDLPNGIISVMANIYPDIFLAS